MAQLVKRPTLDFNSGHDLAVCEFKPNVGLALLTVQSLLGILSLPLFLPFPYSLSLKIINLKKKKKVAWAKSAWWSCYIHYTDSGF